MPNDAAKKRGCRAAAAPFSLPLLLLLLTAPLALLLLLLVPAQAQTAQASSYSAAAPGSTSSVSSNAVATEPGSSVVVVAIGVAPNGGERVVVSCNLAAAHASEQLAKYCEGVPLPSSGSSSSSSSGSNNSASGNNNKNSNNDDKEEARAWRAAPICGKDAARGAKVVALDSAGRAWAREPDEPTGKLCAFRDEISEDSGAAAAVAPNSGARGKDAWASAPDCVGDEMTDYLTRDREGNAWGWGRGESCAWRNVKPQGGGSG